MTKDVVKEPRSVGIELAAKPRVLLSTRRAEAKLLAQGKEKSVKSGNQTVSNITVPALALEVSSRGAFSLLFIFWLANME